MQLVSAVAVSFAVSVSADVLSLVQRSVSSEKQAPSVERKPATTEPTVGWSWIDLDEKTTAQHGSVCLNGDTPGYFYKAGSKDDKWILSFEGGAMACTSEEDCHSMTTGGYLDADGIMEMTLFDDEAFADFHKTQFHHCDGGLWLGDSSQTLVYSGKTMYMRGKRILDDTIEHLTQTTSLATATEVLITGGSGGGHAVFLVADYMSTLLPKTVTKIGAAPMSGFVNANSDSNEWVYKTHGVSSAITPGCTAAFTGTEQYKCLEPKYAYAYSKVPMFIVQVLDEVGINDWYYDNETSGQTAVTAWRNCLDDPNGQCDTTGVASLQTYLDEMTGAIKSTSKYSQKGEGGFISTCTKHVFYKMEEYNRYGMNGVSIADAVKSWWANLGNADSQWSWPCELNEHGKTQCEESCSYDTCKLPEGANDQSCR